MQKPQEQDFKKVLMKQKADLANIKKVLDEQTEMLNKLQEEFKKLGIDPSQLPSIDKLPIEYQEEYAVFSRKLNEVTEILYPQRVKPKPTARRKRNMI